MGPVLEDFTCKQASLADTPYIITKQFPWKLHEMLEHVETDGNESIVSWFPSGRAFKVHRADEFVEKVMKNHFQQTKYKSFRRQLNLWGFERNTEESLERGSYCHPLFVKDRKDLCQKMGRQKVKPKPMSAKAAAALSSSSSTSPVPSSTIFSKPAETPATMMFGAVNASTTNQHTWPLSLSGSASTGVDAAAGKAAIEAVANSFQSPNLPVAVVVANPVSSAADLSCPPANNATSHLLASLLAAASAAQQTSAAQSSVAELLSAVAVARQQQQQQNEKSAARNSGVMVMMHALRLHVVKQASNNDHNASSLAWSLLQAQQQQQQQSNPLLLMSPAPHSPNTNSAMGASMSTNPLAHSDQEVIQALQRRAALESFLQQMAQQQQQHL